MILASKSPRRKEILKDFGFEIKVDSVDIEEVSDKKEIVDQLMDISRKKSEGVAKKYPEEYVVSADTAVIIGEEMLGKPRDKKHAAQILGKLSGRKHKVITAYTLFNISKNISYSHYDTTLVYFKELSSKEIEWYIETGEPMDKAGAYGIQGKGTILVDKIEGDFYNVMGFPMSKFYEDLKKLGLDISNINQM